MFFYINEYMNWFKKWREPKKEEEKIDPLSQIIRKRALEQKAVIDNKEEENGKENGEIKTVPFGIS